MATQTQSRSRNGKSARKKAPKKVTKKDAATKSKEVAPIQIVPIDLQELAVPIVGTSPLIMHCWDPEILREIEHQRLTGIKPPKRVMDDVEKLRTYEATIYWINKKKKRFGFPATGFKKALVRAAKLVGIEMTTARGLFHVIPDAGSPYVEVTGTPRMRMDVVRLNGKTMDLRYRACFDEWNANVRVQFNAGLISPTTLATLFRHAGFSVGIGEWRPERDGPYGLFNVDAKQFAKLVK